MFFVVDIKKKERTWRTEKGERVDKSMCLIMCHQLFTVTYFILLFADLGLGSVEYEGKQYVREGSPFAITCKRPPLRPPKWTKDGITLEEEDNSYKIEKETRKANIVVMKIAVDMAQLKHRGEYKCDSMSNNSHKIEVVPSAETDETWRLEATKRLHNNETLELYCAEVDNNIVDVEWYKDGYRISENSRIETSGQRRRTLTVKNASEKDAGDYTCSALGTTRPYLLSEQKGYVIHVTHEARVEKFQHQIRPIFGRNFTLECKVHGYPVPRVTWFIDDQPAEIFVQNHTRISVQDNAQGLPNSVLFIQNVTFEDGYKVRCHAENFEGSTETSVSLAVMENMISTNEIEPGKGIVLIPGSELKLQCNVTDNPEMNVNWLRNGYPLNVTDDRINLKEHNTLTIVRTTEGDTGSYMCEVNDENVKANATVIVRTEIKLQPFDHSRNIVEGQNIVLICNVTQGTPLPTLQWLKDKEPLNLSDPRISTESDRGIEGVKLTIKESEFDDRAEYTCVATNDFGSVNGTILVRIKDKFAALWPFLGICAEVAILITIIFIYEKKRQKPDYDESEADHNTENKAVPDQEDKTQDVRQRK